MSVNPLHKSPGQAQSRLHRLLPSWWLRLPGHQSSPAAAFSLNPSHRADLEVDALARGETWSEDSPVFPPLAGARVIHSMFNVPFKACLKAARLAGHFSYHSLRHTFASIHLNEGTNLAWVSQHLGHTDARTTAEVYGRWLKAKAAGAADALDRAEGNISSRRGWRCRRQRR